LLGTRPALDDAPSDEVHDALRDRLLRAGASFWPDLVAAVGTADEGVVLTALWDLVWAGEVTNDTFGPLRVARRITKRGATRGRPQPGRLARLGPPAGAGRWSLVVPLLEPAPAPTEAAHAIALQLLDRHGVVTREGVRGEGLSGGYAGVYPVLRALEESGRARRGWFVAGLGAAQFALPGAVDRLRSHRHIDTDDERARVLVLAATDPAQPYGAALSWPEHTGRPSRSAGAYVVLVDGECAAYIERSGKALLTFGTAPTDTWAGALVESNKEGRLLRLQIERIDDEPARTSPHAEALRTAGFADGYKGLTLRD
jgi:ATP-dependent Lhr-like helicase